MFTLPEKRPLSVRMAAPLPERLELSVKPNWFSWIHRLKCLHHLSVLLLRKIFRLLQHHPPVFVNRRPGKHIALFLLKRISEVRHVKPSQKNLPALIGSKAGTQTEAYRQSIAKGGIAAEAKDISATYPDGVLAYDPVFENSYETRLAPSDIVEAIALDDDADIDALIAQAERTIAAL